MSAARSGGRTNANTPFEAFVSYSRVDQALRTQFETHLKPLQQERLISLWHDGQINAASEWDSEIKKHLRSARLILLLVSPDFLASDYVNITELNNGLRRHKATTATVIRGILGTSDWKHGP